MHERDTRPYRQADLPAPATIIRPWRLVRRVLQWGLGSLAAIIAVLIVIAGVVYLIARQRNAFPMAVRARPAAEIVPAWWEKPPALTESEVEYQRWLSDITWRLPRERWDEHWNIGGNQYGVTAIRYQAAFVGYAAAVLGMRTPAYPSLTGRILQSTLDHLVDRKAWSYIGGYWREQPWFPDPCFRENVMYTGHLLQLLTMYEAATGDPRYRIQGFDLTWDATHSFHYDTIKLVDVTVGQMRDNACGGVTCEPGLIFFPCNNHPHVALTQLEGMGLGNWAADHRKWESWALSSYYSVLGGGAIKFLYHEPTSCFVPRGHPGLDGWAILWLTPWVSDLALARQMWPVTVTTIDWPAFAASATNGSAAEPYAEATCCTPIKAPLAPVASFLAPAARACGDIATAIRLEEWLDRRFHRVEAGRAWMNTERAWRIGVTANRLLALAQANGADIRALVRRPLPREYFAGPLLIEVLPDTASVYQAYVDRGTLVVDIDGGGQDTTLRFGGVLPGSTPQGIAAGQWRWEGDRLVLPALGRCEMRIGRAAASAGNNAVK